MTIIVAVIVETGNRKVYMNPGQATNCNIIDGRLPAAFTKAELLNRSQAGTAPRKNRLINMKLAVYAQLDDSSPDFGNGTIDPQGVRWLCDDQTGTCSSHGVHLCDGILGRLHGVHHLNLILYKTRAAPSAPEPTADLRSLVRAMDTILQDQGRFALYEAWSGHITNSIKHLVTTAGREKWGDELAESGRKLRKERNKAAAILKSYLNATADERGEILESVAEFDQSLVHHLAVTQGATSSLTLSDLLAHARQYGAFSMCAEVGSYDVSVLKRTGTSDEKKMVDTHRKRVAKWFHRFHASSPSSRQELFAKLTREEQTAVVALEPSLAKFLSVPDMTTTAAEPPDPERGHGRQAPDIASVEKILLDTDIDHDEADPEFVNQLFGQPASWVPQPTVTPSISSVLAPPDANTWQEPYSEDDVEFLLRLLREELGNVPHNTHDASTDDYGEQPTSTTTETERRLARKRKRTPDDDPPQTWVWHHTDPERERKRRKDVD